MRIISEKTFVCEIYIAGEMSDIERICAEFCMSGLCVSIEPVKFVYTGGRETGAVVRLVNYPRFPATPASIRTTARLLADKLIEGCCQWSALLIDSENTEWRTNRPEEQERPKPSIGRK